MPAFSSKYIYERHIFKKYVVELTTLQPFEISQGMANFLQNLEPEIIEAADVTSKRQI